MTLGGEPRDVWRCGSSSVDDERDFSLKRFCRLIVRMARITFQICGKLVEMNVVAHKAITI